MLRCALSSGNTVFFGGGCLRRESCKSRWTGQRGGGGGGGGIRPQGRLKGIPPPPATHKVVWISVMWALLCFFFFLLAELINCWLICAVAAAFYLTSWQPCHPRRCISCLSFSVSPFPKPFASTRSPSVPHSPKSWLTGALPVHQRTPRRTPTWTAGSHLRPAASMGSPAVRWPAGGKKARSDKRCDTAVTIQRKRILRRQPGIIQPLSRIHLLWPFLLLPHHYRYEQRIDPWKPPCQCTLQRRSIY